MPAGRSPLAAYSSTFAAGRSQLSTLQSTGSGTARQGTRAWSPRRSTPARGGTRGAEEALGVSSTRLAVRESLDADIESLTAENLRLKAKLDAIAAVLGKSTESTVAPPSLSINGTVAFSFQSERCDASTTTNLSTANTSTTSCPCEVTEADNARLCIQKPVSTLAVTRRCVYKNLYLLGGKWFYKASEGMSRPCACFMRDCDLFAPQPLPLGTQLDPATLTVHTAPVVVDQKYHNSFVHSTFEEVFASYWQVGGGQLANCTSEVAGRFAGSGGWACRGVSSNLRQSCVACSSACISECVSCRCASACVVQYVSLFMNHVCSLLADCRVTGAVGHRPHLPRPGLRPVFSPLRTRAPGSLRLRHARRAAPAIHA
jgi:hypothetical protein